MIGDVARGLEIARKAPRTRSQIRVNLHLKSEPINFGVDNPITNSNIVITNGSVTLKYCPSSQKKYRFVPYLIKSEILPNNIRRFASWEDFEEKSKKNDRIAFVFKYAGITKEDFEIAYENIGIDIYFGINLPKYQKDVKDKIEARTGVRPKDSVFFSKEENENERYRYKMFLENNNVHVEV